MRRLVGDLGEQIAARYSAWSSHRSSHPAMTWSTAKGGAVAFAEGCSARAPQGSALLAGDAVSVAVARAVGGVEAVADLEVGDRRRAGRVVVSTLAHDAVRVVPVQRRAVLVGLRGLRRCRADAQQQRGGRGGSEAAP